jgi:arylformamidase
MRRLLVGLLLACSSIACNPVYFVGVKFVYRKAPLPERQIIRNFSYAAPSDDPKQQLDLYMPTVGQWPVVVFVHGGGWTTGDRALRVGGADIYGNIGRFLASNGIGAAVISYRLVPRVTWREQADDVVQAVRWVAATAPVYGAMRDAIVLAGHSAGAQLAARTALDRTALARAGVSASAIRGMFLVSGAGYDLADPKTYELGHDRAFYENVFKRASQPDGWAAGSALPLVAAGAPPAVVLHAGGDDEALKYQSRVLHEALTKAGARSRLVEVPGLSHTRIVPTISRDDREAGMALLEFVRDVTGAGDQ